MITECIAARSRTTGLGIVILLALATIGDTAPSAAQTRLNPQTGEWDRIGQNAYWHGYRVGREDERASTARRTEADERQRGNYFARYGFRDPWFSYGYGFTESDFGGFDGWRADPGADNNEFGLFRRRR